MSLSTSRDGKSISQRFVISCVITWSRRFLTGNVLIYVLQATPQQENAFDCGVFTCQFMEGASRGEDADTFGFNQDDMPYLRRRMLWEISQARLAGWKIAAVC